MSEIRRISERTLEISRAVDGNKDLVVEGYAAVWDSESNLLSDRKDSGFIERIAPYAFTKALANLEYASVDCVATYQHVRSTLLARTSSGTLTLTQDEVGLKFRFIMPNTSIGRDLSEMLSRGDISKCSFVARINPDMVKVERNRDGIAFRTIEEFTMIKDVSLVIDPAYSSTDVQEIERAMETLKEEESKKAQKKAEALDLERNLQEQKDADLLLINGIIENYEA